jgi:NadR type nicotinamide-nucleotide adenylyltransferase
MHNKPGRLKTKTLKIAITGPESTGKSNLAQDLASHYHAAFVPEFARVFIDNLNRNYTYDDILTIAQNQLLLEADLEKHAKQYLFCDTELIVTRIWSLHKYGKCDDWITEQITRHTYDLYLLCDIDLPWQFDKQREHPHLRKFFFDWYKSELKYFGLPYEIVSGMGEARLRNAINLIDDFLKNKNE